MSEEIITFGNARSLVGIFHRPKVGAVRKGTPMVIMLNAGILHRVGPNRLYVRIARELECRGFRVLRFDLWGIGDSQDHTGELQHRTFFDDTLEAMDMLSKQEGASEFMLMGICMGAKIALDVASKDSRVTRLVLMEGIYVKSARYYITRVLDPGKWLKMVRGESHFVKQVRKRLSKHNFGKGSDTGPGNGPPSSTLFLDESSEQNMKANLQTLLDRGAKTLLVFRDGNEIAYNYRLRETGDDIFAIGVPQGLDVRFVKFADHTFTPLVSQELLLKVTMDWIESHHVYVAQSLEQVVS